MIFYTYMWLREDGTPYYVGKGTYYRVFRLHRIGQAPPKERILLEPHTSEAEALDAEKFLIVYYGQECLGTGCLLNMTAGGEGLSGYTHTEVTLRKMSAAQEGKTKSIETRKRLSASLKNRTLSQEHKRNISTGNLGRIVSPLTRSKISASKKAQQKGRVSIRQSSASW